MIPPYHWWRTVFFLIPAISVYTIVLGAVSIVSSLFDRRGYFAHGCARAWSWLILKTTGVRVTVEGLERVDAGHDLRLRLESPEHLRHPGHLRVAAVPAAHHREGRRSRGFPCSAGTCRRGGHLFVDRRHPDRAGILKRWRALVSEGLSLIIFAEGTRSPDGRVARFKAGSFLLAIEAGLPIVPLAVIGTRAGDAEGTAADRAGRRAARSSTIRFSRRRSTQPTVRDAKALADRVHAIVAAPSRRRSEQDAESRRPSRRY